MAAIQLSMDVLESATEQRPRPALGAESTGPQIASNKGVDEAASASQRDSGDPEQSDQNDPNSKYLGNRDRSILALERQWFRNPGSKEAAIMRQFGMTPTRYFQILNGLLDDPRAMRESPQIVARLRRVRAARQRSRRHSRRVLRNGYQRTPL